MDKEYDLIIIGAGPGGTDAAEEAASIGLKTAIIEKSCIGGTCLNRGCIPTKTILHTAELYREAREGNGIGIINNENLKVDAAVLQENKESILDKLRSGLTYTMEHCGVDIIEGTGVITDRNHVKVGDSLIEADNIMIATGSVPGVPPIPGSDLPNVVTSDEMLSLDRIPESLVIIGGGVIGIEFAAIYSSLGCRVTVIEFLKRALCNLDKEIGRSVSMVLGKRGVDIHTNSRVEEITPGSDGKTLRCIYEEKGKACEAEGEMVLIAAGRRPYTDGLICDESSEEVKQLKMEKGRIVVDENYETSVPGIYAIGDAIGGIQLAHVASAEGRNAAAHIAGGQPPVRMNEVPSCVYTDPEIACVGITADDAKEAGIKVIARKYPMSGNGKSVLTQQERGFIKIIADAESEKILGAQMMCARATDMISQFSQAIASELTLDDLSKFIYPHPTFCEGIGKAAGR